MISFEVMDINSVIWDELDTYEDRTIFQTLPWINFISETQNAEPVIVEISDDNQTLGYFTGLIIKRFGLKILGSPFPGWTTSYMGFNLKNGVERSEILKMFIHFVFKELQCIHLELMDCNLTEEDCKSLKVDYSLLQGYKVNLDMSKKLVFSNLSKNCRRDVRRAKRNGIVVEISDKSNFSEEYYSQLKDVFAKQSLIPTYSIERIRSLINHLYPTGNLLLLKALDNKGHCIATGIFIKYNKVMYYYGGASWREYQYLLPNEAVIWYAMEHWMERDITCFDMGGGGSYKRKYGGRQISVPWLRISKYKLIPQLRNFGKDFVKFKQRLSARIIGKK